MLEISIQHFAWLLGGTWTLGVSVGGAAVLFVTKKQCKTHRAELKHDWTRETASIWRNIDGINTVLAGGKMRFELRAVREDA